MAFLEQLFSGNLSPEQNQGLLAAAAALLQNSGPSPRPVSFGQGVASAIQAYQHSTADAEERKRQREQQALQARLLGLKVQDAESDLENQRLTRENDQKYREWLKSDAAAFANGGTLQRDIPSPNSLAAGKASLPALFGTASPPRIGNPMFDEDPLGNPAVVQRIRSMLPPQQQIGNRQSLYERGIAKSERARAAGFSMQADALANDALKFQPQVDSWKQVIENGRVLYKPYFKDGTSGDAVTSDVAEKLMEVNSGGRTDLVNGVTGAIVRSIGKTATPGDLLVDARQREANQIASQGKVATTSTALRKEFDDLPEVKAYKAALPAYNAIIDAAGRNSPQSDINLVYGIAKLYDPNSVVREGEYNTVANSPNIPERIKGYAQYLAGGGRLTQQVKDQIKQEAAGRIKSFEQPYAQARSNYSEIANRTGGDSSLLFPSQFAPAQAPAPRSAPKNGQPPSKIVSLDDGSKAAARLAADGNYYVKRNGKFFRYEE